MKKHKKEWPYDYMVKYLGLWKAAREGVLMRRYQEWFDHEFKKT